ncbi:MAG: T9SS type A sorting domain-containing protein [Chitinophagaceae bacterium]|nr:T9SS type A sorting domain-containing protein [Bacteroidota bacterium]MCC6259166.1 T9SS type A sorting domain-containing protein [Chitinophagaceae bacterium]
MNIKILLTSGFLVASLASSAQSDKAYAITGSGVNDFKWMNIREVDLGTGQVVNTVFERSITPYQMTDVATKKTVDQTATANVFGSRDYPTATFVAAAAFDKRTNKLFFTPMRMGELRWLDLNEGQKTPRFYTLCSDMLRSASSSADEGANITRMVIGADGNGYAISNDGNHLFRFTTGRHPVITDLGALMDDESNKGISVHNKCTSWGGDMLADAFGNLYIISANHMVFKVNLETRNTLHIGNINGLPAGYSTNAAAVNKEGEIVIASANVFDGYYKFSLDNFNAIKLEGSDKQFNASDLAGSNLLLQKEADAVNKFDMSDSKLNTLSSNAGTRIYPNPITTNKFNILFDEKADGNYSVVLSDLAGRVILTRKVSITKGGQLQSINVPANLARGMYMVNVLDASRHNVITEKVLIQ